MADEIRIAPRARLRTTERSPVSVDADWLDSALPTLVRANLPGLDLAAWITENRAEVARLAHTAGAVLFRGFAVDSADDFKVVMEALTNGGLPYGERSSPRTEVMEGIYTSTEHPADQPILLHNEQSYTTDWPLHIVFHCRTEPTRGGRTPLADSRKVLARLRPETVAAFEERGIRYVRNYVPGLSLSWHEAFGTDRREDVEAYGLRNDIQVEWIGEDQLRTSQLRQAVRRHPVTGEHTWFNHALFFHATSLPPEVRDGLLSALDEADLPYNTYYGDGGRIEESVLAELRAAYEAETTSFAWREGDVLMVENMLVAHAREPFEGPRRILTAMATQISSTECQI